MNGNFVLGFLFNSDKTQVCLLLKDHPEMLSGKLNGIGGRIETGEDSGQAMAREFLEETGTAVDGWTQFGVVKSDKMAISLFRAQGDYSIQAGDRSEPAAWYHLTWLLMETKLAPNLLALIFAARNLDSGYLQITEKNS